MSSRSRKQYQNIDIAPRSSALVPSHTRWLMIRLSSMWMTRRYCARAGTSTSSSVSVAPQNAYRVEVVREVVHPLDDRDRLPVGLVLGGLLDARVDVADDRLEVAHDLAVERDEQPQHPVRGGVMRAHVQREQLRRGVVRGHALDGRHRDRLLERAVVVGRRDAHCV